MMNKSFVDIQLKGEGFSPTLLQQKTNLPLEIIVESGDIAKIGRYKGEKSPFGIGIISFEFSAEKILEWSNKLKSLKSELDLFNVSEIIFDLEADDEVFSFLNISSELVKNLAALNADFNIRKTSNTPSFEKMEY